MRKNLIALVAIALLSTGANAAGTFGVNAGFGSSISQSGGSSATAGTNGNGTSAQFSTSGANGASYGGTGFSTGQILNTPAVYSDSITGAYSNTTAKANGTTTGDAYGNAKSGAGVDYSSYGYGNVAGSYSTGF